MVQEFKEWWNPATAGKVNRKLQILTSTIWGAFYGDEKHWEVFQKFAFEAALNSTDVVVQPRQSNTWGALSLDHVYEFMGGMNLAVRNITGKDPDAYLSDYRNRNNMKMQELKEAVGVKAVQRF